jgi:hypothetical protein
MSGAVRTPTFPSRLSAVQRSPDASRGVLVLRLQRVNVEVQGRAVTALVRIVVERGAKGNAVSLYTVTAAAEIGKLGASVPQGQSDSSSWLWSPSYGGSGTRTFVNE